ncbi:hypothetical protein Pvag_pPag20197 (plasmid) [Pantoea vagans C9-1]|nr:hypothetical protein Pvag_pPag20197 [Pantoea vagans C9-1]
MPYDMAVLQALHYGILPEKNTIFSGLNNKSLFTFTANSPESAE